MTTPQTVGREPIQIIELDQPFCQLTYSIAPCTAALGVTGDDKCFNGIQTCQDLENIDLSGVQTLRFVKPRSNAPKDVYLIPSLVGVSTSPTVINAGGGNKDRGAIGVRSVMTATFMDHPHSDLVVDKYQEERAYIATDRSTFWAKWLARNPFYQNKTVRVLDGYVGQALAAMQSRTYLIESINGPDSSGRVTLRAKDVLTLADDDKAQAPAPTFGELNAAIDDVVTSIVISGHTVSEYPSGGGLIRIGDELITYTSTTDITTTLTFNGCVRGVQGSTAESHALGDRVQLCKQYTAEKVVDVVFELLTVFANVDPAFIDKATWDAEGDLWLSQFAVTTTLTDPTGVNQLLGELTEQAQFYLWWDEREKLINLRAVRPAAATATLTDEANILANSVQITVQPKDRITQVWVFWDIKDPTQDPTQDSNYAKLEILADLDLETADRYGEAKIRKIHARWLTSDAQAINLTSRMLSRYKVTPRTMSVSLDAKDRDLWTGDIAEVSHRGIVNELGEVLELRWQVISADEADSGHVIKYTLQDFSFIADRVAFWMADAAPDFTDATVNEKDNGMWWADDDGLMSDGTAGYTWQ
jgi:hypothetical protein